MRSAVLLALLLLMPAISSSQGFMRFYRMTYGLSGFYLTGSSDTDIDFVTGREGAVMDRDVFRVSSRNGFFVTRNFVIGAEVNWEQVLEDSRPDPNPGGNSVEGFERRVFIGPLFRLYQMMTMRWYLYPEVSLGYTHFVSEIQETGLNLGNLPRTITARGFAVNAGAGFGYLLTRNVIFDVSARYMRAWRDGEYEVPGTADVDVDMTEWDLQLLVGFQLLM